MNIITVGFQGNNGPGNIDLHVPCGAIGRVRAQVVHVQSLMATSDGELVLSVENLTIHFGAKLTAAGEIEQITAIDYSGRLFLATLALP